MCSQQDDSTGSARASNPYRAAIWIASTFRSARIMFISASSGVPIKKRANSRKDSTAFRFNRHPHPREWTFCETICSFQKCRSITRSARRQNRSIGQHEVIVQSTNLNPKNAVWPLTVLEDAMPSSQHVIEGKNDLRPRRLSFRSESALKVPDI
jgi:hypothetical protein